MELKLYIYGKMDIQIYIYIISFFIFSILRFFNIKGKKKISGIRFKKMFRINIKECIPRIKYCFSDRI